MVTDDKPVALVTGANRGLGLETSRQLGQSGVKVLIGSRGQGKGEQAATTLKCEGVDAEVIQLDVGDADSIAAAIAAIIEDYGDTVKPMSPDEAVAKILFLLDVGADAPCGGFFSNGEPVAW